MKVYKVADIVNREVVFCAARMWKPGDLAALLTNVEPVEKPRSDCAWKMELIFGQGAETRTVMLDIAPCISVEDPQDEPLFFVNDALVYYLDRLFIPERAPKSLAEREEVSLRVKKAVYDEESELASLKATVANIEAAIEYTRTGPKRSSIAEDVKLLVWARDGGACVQCGSKHALHFDHIIPVAKGGGNSEENIQVLCRTCNLKKSDKIGQTDI